MSTGEAVTAGESAVDAYTLNPVSSLVTLRPWAARLIAPPSESLPYSAVSFAEPSSGRRSRQ